MKTKMNQYVRTLYEQIGREAFFMMNARHITADNQQNALKWHISGSPVSRVCVTYRREHDLYELGFMLESATHLTEVVIEQVAVDDLHKTIERMTGLSLTVPRVQFAQ